MILNQLKLQSPNGDIFIADGYGKDFIIKYDSSNYVKHFGGRGERLDQFDCCHGITLDTRDKNNSTLLISSRTKNEFKRFDLNGNHRNYFTSRILDLSSSN